MLNHRNHRLARTLAIVFAMVTSAGWAAAPARLCSPEVLGAFSASLVRISLGDALTFFEWQENKNYRVQGNKFEVYEIPKGETKGAWEELTGLRMVALAAEYKYAQQILARLAASAAPKKKTKGPTTKAAKAAVEAAAAKTLPQLLLEVARNRYALTLKLETGDYNLVFVTPVTFEMREDDLPYAVESTTCTADELERMKTTFTPLTKLWSERGFPTGELLVPLYAEIKTPAWVQPSVAP